MTTLTEQERKAVITAPNTTMTKEQAQNLKIGDKIKLAEPLTVIDPKGVNEKILAQTQEGNLVFVKPREAQLADPSPSEASHDEATAQAGKYDPCRKFKERDKVRYCAPDGRIYADRGSLREHIKNRDFTHVVRDEQENGRVGVYDPLDEENPYYVPAHALELITPVEELESYEVQEDVEKSVYPRHDKTNGTKNDEPTPKYDPCRKFREGDIVEPCQVKGRWFGTAWEARSGIRFTVTKDEDEEGVMWVQDPDSLHSKDVEAVFFQLVVPVEELAPYSVIDSPNTYNICKAGESGFLATYHKRLHPNAKVAAEDECARLNAAYRKGKRND